MIRGANFTAYVVMYKEVWSCHVEIYDVELRPNMNFRHKPPFKGKITLSPKQNFSQQPTLLGYLSLLFSILRA